MEIASVLKVGSSLLATDLCVGAGILTMNEFRIGSRSSSLD